MRLVVTRDSGSQAEIYLQPWYSLKKNGWVCGDGHDHLYTDKKPDTAMAATLRKICLAQGIDFVCAAQGWAGYNDSNWREGYSRFSDSNFPFVEDNGDSYPLYNDGAQVLWSDPFMCADEFMYDTPSGCNTSW